MKRARVQRQCGFAAGGADLGPLARGSDREPSMPTTTANGYQLFYELGGTTGDPLVLVHGSWVSHHDWGLVVPGLSETFRVLA
jgi:hypothetical protein